MKRFRYLYLAVMVGAFTILSSAIAFAAEPADYSTEVSSFVGTVAGEAWPIALAIFTALIGITLGVGVLRFILAKGRSLARGG